MHEGFYFSIATVPISKQFWHYMAALNMVLLYCKFVCIHFSSKYMNKVRPV